MSASVPTIAARDGIVGSADAESYPRLATNLTDHEQQPKPQLPSKRAHYKTTGEEDEDDDESLGVPAAVGSNADSLIEINTFLAQAGLLQQEEGAAASLRQEEHREDSKRQATAGTKKQPVPGTMASSPQNRASPRHPRRLVSRRASRRSSSRTCESVHYTAPDAIATASDVSATYTCRPVRAKTDGDDEACVICLEPMTKDIAHLNKCQHEFHESCIHDALLADRKCPVCRHLVLEPQGRSPSGTMSISAMTGHFRGIDCNEVFVINYAMESGVQKQYHPSPGRRFSGTHRTAYLPANEEGKKLLARLKYAFSKGLMFAVGTSLTTGQPNVITWASIHVKTSLTGGVHGFPDPGYFTNCSEELDIVGVPLAEDLMSAMDVDEAPQAQPTAATSPSGLGPGDAGAGWRSDKDVPHRREIIQHIVKMLRERGNCPPADKSNFPRMVKQLEVSLYCNATSFEAYRDISTLKQRLQQISLEALQAKDDTSSMEVCAGGVEDEEKEDSRAQPATSVPPGTAGNEAVMSVSHNVSLPPQNAVMVRAPQPPTQGITAPVQPSANTSNPTPDATPTTRRYSLRSRRNRHGRGPDPTPQAAGGVLQYTAPDTLSTSNDVPSTYTCLPARVADGNSCSVCLDPMSEDVVRLNKCQHEFHKSCIHDVLKVDRKCPVCRRLVMEPQGHSPSGTMSIRTMERACGGFDCKQSFVIEYNLPGGTQKQYHPNPGVRFSSTHRTAYLPANEEGKKLLKRLRYAFSRGLTFTVGTSLTSGQPNVITWGTIPHKTNLHGGQFGFPDPGFFLNCGGILEAVGVPPAEDCPSVP